MIYRKLGHTGFDVSAVGFGTWQIGGGRWQSMSDSECVAMLQAAAEDGINIFDAAYVYGQYRDDRDIPTSRSLELLGKAFEDPQWQDRVFICLKLGQLEEFSHGADYSPRRVIENFKHALKLLRREKVDIALIHAPSLSEVKDRRAFTILETLKALELVRAVGYSFENEPDHVAAALRQPADVIMLQYNLIDSQCGPMLDRANEKGVGILVGGPLKRGYLSGRYRTMDDLAQADDYWRWNVNRNPGKVADLLDRSNRAMQAHGRTAKALRRAALDFILQKPAVGSAIIGHRNLDEVSDNLDTLESLATGKIEAAAEILQNQMVAA